MGAREIVVVSRRGPVTYDALYAEHADAQLLVNATPVGMYPNTGVSPVELDRLPNLSKAWSDVIYNPERTAADAGRAGTGAFLPCRGLTMLVAQAREARRNGSSTARRPGEVVRDHLRRDSRRRR